MLDMHFDPHAWPLYQCHKQVRALKIAAILRAPACCENAEGVVCGEPRSAHTPEAARGDVGLDHDFIAGTWDVPGATIVPQDPQYPAFLVTEDFLEKHGPVAGGYIVKYADGYLSFSPAQAFEEGYSPLV
jgi:hypothetical protein